VKLYGIPASQASRCLWVLEELDLDYEFQITRPGVETRSDEILRLNPNRRIPVLVDAEVVLWESLAINLYLAERYGADRLWSHRVEERAAISQWSFWVANDVEPHLWRLWQEGDRQAGTVLSASLEILEAHLSHRDWVVGETFSVADLNLESYIIRARRGNYPLNEHPRLFDWIERCESRPARKRVREMILDYEAAAESAPGQLR